MYIYTLRAPKKFNIPDCSRRGVSQMLKTGREKLFNVTINKYARRPPSPPLPCLAWVLCSLALFLLASAERPLSLARSKSPLVRAPRLSASRSIRRGMSLDLSQNLQRLDLSRFACTTSTIEGLVLEVCRERFWRFCGKHKGAENVHKSLDVSPDSVRKKDCLWANLEWISINYEEVSLIQSNIIAKSAKLRVVSDQFYPALSAKSTR